MYTIEGCIDFDQVRPRPSELRVAHIWEFSPAAAADPASHACDRAMEFAFGRSLSRTRAGFRGRDAAGYPALFRPEKNDLE